MQDQKKKRSKMSWFLRIGGGLLLLFSLWQLVTSNYVVEEKAVRSQVREIVAENFPQQAEKFSRTIGLFSYPEGKGAVGSDVDVRQSVVLIHGLDDPGKVWQNLAPQLAAEGYDVWEMNYPNDQPIVESSLLFSGELHQLYQLGRRSVSLVAHSMGGLVSRELLTSPTISYRHLVQQGKAPKVERLIMVGTPNHGSQMARFRIFGEIRDHFDRLFNGQANPLGFILDGAGEAKIDLLPGSSFLTELNGRKNPEYTDMLIIAGISTPWNKDDVARWLDGIGQLAGKDHREELDAVGWAMISMSNEVGDGLVTLESARLPGVPFITVNGTHLSMIRNITESSSRVPPAIPIIVNALKQDS